MKMNTPCLRVRILPGMQFGRWTVLARATHINKSRDVFFWCRCICKKKKRVNSSNLRRGISQSCGCLRDDLTSLRQRTHGHTAGRLQGNRKVTPEYRSWRSMHKRCGNPNVPQYKNYGGRGIRVCLRWHKFENFLADIGARPGSMFSIERVNNMKGYSLSNCIWATCKEQSVNKRNTRMLTLDGRTQCLKDWGRELGRPYQTIDRRIRVGWSVKKALTAPFRRAKILTFKGQSLRVDEWALKLGCSSVALFNRLKQGYTVQETLSVPLKKDKRRVFRLCDQEGNLA